MKRIPIRALILTLLVTAGGCGGPPPEPAVVEIPGYGALQEPYDDRDMSPLRGRRIVLDPGHGGFFQGAVGSAGLTEAEVNLGVALYLRGLLEWAEAEVFMTRTADYDFLSAADSTLAGDLAFRVSFTDSLQPDVFLSLHHNSVASLDRTVNETQTYYPLGDDGASLDLARAIHRHLVVNLEISPAKILPGNFHVLRNANVPAVLGEPAMISHPVIEGRLSLAASQRLEAEAYFLGLLDYFSQGTPRWSGAPVDTLYVRDDQVAVEASWIFLADISSPAVDSSAVPGPDPGTFTLTREGIPVPFHVTEQGRRVAWRSSNLGLLAPAILELKGRNLAGRATPVRRTFLMPAPPERVDLWLFPESSGENEAREMAVRWWVRGTSPLPEGRFVWSENREFSISGGLSGTGLIPQPDSMPERVTFHPADPGLIDLPCDLTVTELPAPWNWRLLNATVDRDPVPWSLRSGSLTGVPTGLADQDIPLVPQVPGQPVFLAVPGMLPFIDPDPANPDTARTIFADDRVWTTEPIAPNLLGKVIVLDPAGGNSDANGTGPLGTRGATLNLETALLAKDLLEGCGATVILTRENETAPLPEEKILLANTVKADLFLTIRRDLNPGQFNASYHPGSVLGETWARLFLMSFDGLVPADFQGALIPSYDYLLRHTACPALEVRIPGPHTPGQEMILSSRGSLRAEARAVLVSTISLFHPEDTLIPTLDLVAVIGRLADAPRPEDVDWAELDGNLIWSPHPDQLGGPGTHSLSSWGDPGLPDLTRRHTLEIRAGGLRQLWLIEKSGTRLLDRLMIHNP